LSEQRARDRSQTEADIVEAAKRLIARKGFAAVGVNALAREASCDKQLIYRYFGGLDGVIDAVGEDLADWTKTRLRPMLALGQPADYAELMERLALGLLQAFRDDPLMLRLKASEFAAPSPQLARIAAARGLSLQRWIDETRGSLLPPPTVDAPAVNALFIAAIESFAVTAAASPFVYGMTLQSELDWERVRNALKAMIAAIYGASGP
jgi:AcrR family transcriptional regulator